MRPAGVDREVSFRQLRGLLPHGFQDRVQLSDPDSGMSQRPYHSGKQINLLSADGHVDNVKEAVARSWLADTNLKKRYFSAVE